MNPYDPPLVDCVTHARKRHLLYRGMAAFMFAASCLFVGAIMFGLMLIGAYSFGASTDEMAIGTCITLVSTPFACWTLYLFKCCHNLAADYLTLDILERTSEADE